MSKRKKQEYRDNKKEKDFIIEPFEEPLETKDETPGFLDVFFGVSLIFILVIFYFPLNLLFIICLVTLYWFLGKFLKF